MATIKVKFRASSVEMKEGSLYYQVIHNRLARQVHTGYKLFSLGMGCRHFRDRDGSGTEGGGRRNYLLSVKTALAENLSRLRSIMHSRDVFRKPFKLPSVFRNDKYLCI